MILTVMFSYEGPESQSTGFIGKQAIDSAETRKECETLKKKHEHDSKFDPHFITHHEFHCIHRTKEEMDFIQKHGL